MDYLEILDEEKMSPQAREIVGSIKARLGKIPNTYRVMAHSPIALECFIEFHSRLRQGRLKPLELEAVALVIAQITDCLYCISGHTVIAKMNKLSEDQIIDLRMGKSQDPKLDALVKLAKNIHTTQGHPTKEYIKNFFAAGYDQEALIEVIAQVALSVFSGYLNKIARTPVDFPVVKKLQSSE